MPFTEKFYTDAEMTQTPPAGTRVIFQGYSDGTASGDKVLRYKDENGEFGTVSGGGVDSELLDSKADKTSVYTKTEIDSKFGTFETQANAIIGV